MTCPPWHTRALLARSEQHYSPLELIDATNVSRLKPAWSFDFEVPGPADLPLCCDVVNRGVAVYPWNPEFRSAGKGDNLFISSIVALDADTGAYKWHYQEKPGDQWDYDAVQNMSLAELDIGGSRWQVRQSALGRTLRYPGSHA